MRECESALKQWTGKSTASVVDDSTSDVFTFLPDCQGKSDIAIVATTTDGEVFGEFFNVVAAKQIE